MALWRLDDLRRRLEQRGWSIIEHEGDGYAIAATWAIQRDRALPPLLIDFDGLDDMVTLPLERAYGCHLRGNPSVQLYFSRQGHKSSTRRARWVIELAAFVDRLDELP